MVRYSHLQASAFLQDAISARAIDAALKLGVIDRLLTVASLPSCELIQLMAAPRVGVEALLQLLANASVVAVQNGQIQLCDRFRDIMPFRDYLEMRLLFADHVWPDIQTLFPQLLCNPSEFMARSRTFDLFRYDRCLIVNAENLMATRRWTQFTTVLTRYESAAALEHIDLAPVASFIDLGGNTGEFALQVCRRAPGARAIVVDLPVVCEIGRAHVAKSEKPGEADRIQFFPTDLRRGKLPPPADLVSFKSVLHDWPEPEALDLLKAGARLVKRGGRMLIFERAPLDFRKHPFTYALAPDLIFLHFLRPAHVYTRLLGSLGFALDIVQTIELEVDFHLILATRTL